GIAHRDAGHDRLFLRNIGDLANDVGAHDALAVDDAAEPAVPGREHDAITERTEIEVTYRAGIEHAVIGQHQRHRRVELAKAAQHPVLPHRLVVARNPHRAKQFFGDVDLARTMHALIFAVADDVALRFRAGHHLLHVAAAHVLQRPL